MIVSDDAVTTEEVKSWRGLHLLHFQGSSCSQKVRVLLEEKGLDYTSHPINIARNEHVTAWYLGINPRGVVPVLEHDGVVEAVGGGGRLLELLSRVGSSLLLLLILFYYQFLYCFDLYFTVYYVLVLVFCTVLSVYVVKL